MADQNLVVAYVKEEDGSLVPVAAIYDKDGHEITAHYQAKTSVALAKDADGYTIIQED